MIYLIAALIVGLFVGVVLEYFIDVGIIRDLQNENNALRMKLAEAKKSRKVEHIQTVEIVDRRASNPDNLFQPF